MANNGGLSKEGRIGKGTYSVVYKGSKPGRKGDSVAVKVNNKLRDMDFSGCTRELNANHILGAHPFIMPLKEISNGDPFPGYALSPVQSFDSVRDKIHFIYPLAIADLEEYMKRNLDHLTTADVVRFSMEMLLGIEYIHGCGFIHRDIKGANMLIVNDGGRPSIKIGDFGLAKPYTLFCPQTPGVATSWYRAPEVCLGSANYTQAIDMWSAGCVIYQMFSGHPLTAPVEDIDVLLVSSILDNLPYDVPYSEVRDMNRRGLRIRRGGWAQRTMQQFLGLNDGGVVHLNNNGGYDNFTKMLLGLLCFNPVNRLTATRALDHPFFTRHHNYIRKVRSEHPPMERAYPPTAINNNNERGWGMQSAYELYKRRKDYSWFTDRAFFHSIAIFDRLLSSPYFTQRGRMNQRETVLYYVTSLYLAQKYFSTLQPAIPFKNIVSHEYRNVRDIDMAERYEETLIRDVLCYDVYHQTPYDVLCKVRQPQDADITSLLIFIINGHHNGKTANEAYTFWNANRDYYLRGRG